MIKRWTLLGLAWGIASWLATSTLWAADPISAPAPLLSEADFTQTALAVGQKAPAFTLPNGQGEPMALAEALHKGPVVVTFYRGGWCPYCNRALAALQRRLDELKAAGATLIAISPESPEQGAEVVSEQALGFTILSDVDNVVARQFGLVFTLDDQTRDKYLHDYQLPITKKVGTEDVYELPVPGTFVLDQQGQVVWRFVDENYKDRADPDAVVEAVQKLVR